MYQGFIVRHYYYSLLSVTPIAMLNTSKQNPNKQPTTKRSYSYNDLLKMQSTDIYSSIGKVIPSTKPSAPYTTFGHSERKANSKKYESEHMAKIDSIGKIGLGPAAYLPPRYSMQDGQVVTSRNPADDINYQSNPSYSIGKEKRKSRANEQHNYMNNRNDDLDINNADLARKRSNPNIKIGTQSRFKEERKDKITPGPTYDPVMKPQIPKAPQYTLGSRRPVKGQDPLVPTASTTALVGPSSYFQKGKKSQSAILRIPVDSHVKNEPVVSFTKGPKSLATFKNSIDETYDLKTNTIMAHYDFQYDAGKGFNSGLAYIKKNILHNSTQPLQKNKMKSYTITHANRETEQKRGTFISMMSQVPQSLKIVHPKF